MPTLGLINETNLVEKSDGGIAGRRAVGSINTLSAGRWQSLLSSLGVGSAIHRQNPAPPCAEAARTFGGATPFGRAIIAVGNRRVRRSTARQRSRGLIRPTEFASFQHWEELEESCEYRPDSRQQVMGQAIRSGGIRPFEANLAASMPRGSAERTLASHPAPNAIQQRGEIKSIPPRNLQSPSTIFPQASSRNLPARLIKSASSEKRRQVFRSRRFKTVA